MPLALCGTTRIARTTRVAAAIDGRRKGHSPLGRQRSRAWRLARTGPPARSTPRHRRVLLLPHTGQTISVRRRQHTRARLHRRFGSAITPRVRRHTQRCGATAGRLATTADRAQTRCRGAYRRHRCGTPDSQDPHSRPSHSDSSPPVPARISLYHLKPQSHNTSRLLP
jgi:hypothetical protein